MTTLYLADDLRRDEGCVLRAYPDTGGVWTIGVGHTGPEVHRGLVWTQAQANAALSADVSHAERALDQQLAWWRDLSDARQDVLVNMTFNLGVEGLLSFHHTLGAIEAADYAQAAADMLLTQPWRRQIGHRCDRLAAQMRTGVRVDPLKAAA